MDKNRPNAKKLPQIIRQFLPQISERRLGDAEFRLPDGGFSHGEAEDVEDGKDDGQT